MHLWHSVVLLFMVEIYPSWWTTSWELFHTVKMTERYAHLAPERLREAVSVLETGRTFAVPSEPVHRLRQT